MTKTILTLILLGLCVPCFAQGQDMYAVMVDDDAAFVAESGADPSGSNIRLITPRPDSPTAVLRSGVTVDQLKAQGNFTVPYVFTGNEVFSSMTFFNSQTKRIGESKRAYRVPAGTQGFLTADYTRALLPGCGNQGPVTNIFIPPPPAPPAAVAPPPPAPPAPAPCVACEPAPLPICRITGNLEDGFVGTATNGTGTFTFDGQPPEGEDFTLEGNRLQINAADVGTHTVTYAVKGQLGGITCEAKFDVFAELATNTGKPRITVPKIRFCDTDRDGWRPDRMVMGMVQKFRCDPGAMILDTGASVLVGRWVARQWPQQQPVIIKQSVPVITPK